VNFAWYYFNSVLMTGFMVF